MDFVLPVNLKITSLLYLQRRDVGQVPCEPATATNEICGRRVISAPGRTAGVLPYNLQIIVLN